VVNIALTCSGMLSLFKQDSVTEVVIQRELSWETCEVVEIVDWLYYLEDMSEGA
jgi:hypothetical protein